MSASRHPGAGVGALLVLVLLAALALTAPAGAQPKTGIVRPENEDALPLRELGSQLFSGNCSSCHGIDGRGIRKPRPGVGDIEGRGPSLRGVGALSADFYLRTGYMPLAKPGEQPTRSRPLFREREIRALVAYVASLEKGPAIPHPRPRAGKLAEGLEQFTEHCAGCHQVVARGGVATGAKVPPLQDATPRQVAQAVRVGPYVMPTFPKSQISDSQLDSIVAYVQLTKHPVDRGGAGIGNVGPVPEGAVTWLIGALAFLALCIAIGQRLRA